MTEQAKIWDDVRRIADELELKIHLGGMDARDRWRALQPQIAELEASLSNVGTRAVTAIEHELATLGAALRRLRDDITGPAKPS